MAVAFGFDTNDLPHRDTFSRAWRERFDDLQDTIEQSAETIDEIATERGSPIGCHTGMDSSETNGSSKRTEQRLLRKKTKEVLDQMSDVIFPALDIPRPENAIYDEDDMLDLLTVMGVNNEAANNGAMINSDRLAEIRDVDPEDDPFYKDGMRGETLLNALHELAIDEVTEMVNKAAGRAVKRIKPYADFPEPVFLAIDITYVAYYGDREGMKWVSGTPDSKEYSWCHKFATATLVGEGVHMVTAMLPVGNPDVTDNDAYPGDEEKTFVHGDVVRKLLDITSESVTPRRVFADRGFASADVISAFEERNLKYLIPAPRNARTKRWLERNVDMERGILATEQDWAVYGPVKHGVSNDRVTTNLVGVPGDLDDDQYGFGKEPDGDEDDDDEEGTDKAPVPFYTNLFVDDELAVDRRQVMRRIKKYNKRGGIETAYKKIKEFSAWTTSKEFGIRNFHFGFAVLLYNAWLMVDFLVQSGMDMEFTSKPEIGAERFRGYLERQLDRLI